MRKYVVLLLGIVGGCHAPSTAAPDGVSSAVPLSLARPAADPWRGDASAVIAAAQDAGAVDSALPDARGGGQSGTRERSDSGASSEADQGAQVHKAPPANPVLESGRRAKVYYAHWWVTTYGPIPAEGFVDSSQAEVVIVPAADIAALWAAYKRVRSSRSIGDQMLDCRVVLEFEDAHGKEHWVAFGKRQAVMETEDGVYHDIDVPLLRALVDRAGLRSELTSGRYSDPMLAPYLKQ